MFLITTLSKGFKVPATGDKGEPVFNALEDNIERLNNHNHDDLNSFLQQSFRLSRGSVLVNDSGWSASGGLFKKTVTFPAGFNLSNGSEWTKSSIRFYFSGGSNASQECFPKTNFLTDTTFELFSPVSTQAFTVTLV